MNLASIDWVIIFLFFLITIIIGLWSSKKANQSAKDYFLSGRNMPWWLLGVSMVATTFSADTPNLVTDIVRQHGVGGNWVWWAFLLTGMATVFIYAKLWRRSGITTDLEFYELRYSGKAAVFLRGFRSIYLGVFFNVMIMASVMLAGIKIAGIMLGLGPIQTVLLVSTVTVFYSAIGGLRGIILTDFFQFILSMIGMLAAAIFIIDLPEIGSVQNLIAHPNVANKIALFPDFSNPDIAIPMFFIPVAVVWWSAWYPGAEPGGGGYVAQRMLSAKNENDAKKATLFFNFAHYALRPWPWILIALASLIVFPDLESIKQAFPNVDSNIVKHDLAFPAMLTLLPTGLVGLVIASLIAALMSTISTHLNWGSSYIVNDFYVRFIDANASEKKQINIGRLSTIVLMILAGIMALFLSNAMQAFNILLQIGAGTGLLFLLRWFWPRINAFSEIAAMSVSFVVAIFFELIYTGDLLDYEKMLIAVGITTIAWVSTTFLTRPTDINTLKNFVKVIRPHRSSWSAVYSSLEAEGQTIQIDEEGTLAMSIFMMFLGTVLIYSLLFGLGYFIYADYSFAIPCLIISTIAGFLMYRNWK